MHILIDTNIIIDLIQNREPHSSNASKIINSCVKEENVCNNAAWNDLEDGLQMKCAETERLDYIVSRDKENGFKNSPVKVISPEEFLTRSKP